MSRTRSPRAARPLAVTGVPARHSRHASLRPLLTRGAIWVSAPTRVDCGNTLDVKALALLMQPASPATVNIAVDLRVSVGLLPLRDGWVKVTGEGIPEKAFQLSHMRLTGIRGLVAAFLYHFGYDGVHVDVRSEAPSRAGLGSSAAVAVCLVAGLATAARAQGRPALDSMAQIGLAQSLEDGLGFSPSGLQDQLAAFYGGVNLWTWDYRGSTQPFARTELLGPRHQEELSERMLLAFTGERHVPAGLTIGCIRDFVSGAVRSEWWDVAALTREFAKALRRRDWSSAGTWLDQECQLRVRLWPGLLTPIARRLVAAARDAQVGARFCGGGGGGCIWAIGSSRQATARLRKRWGEILHGTRGRILDAGVSRRGLEVRVQGPAR